MGENIPRKYLQRRSTKSIPVPVANHIAVIDDFDTQPVFFGHSVAELVSPRVRGL